MTEKTQPTDAEILDAADDFRSQYNHGGTTFDEFDALGFARAVLAKRGQPSGAGEPCGWAIFRQDGSLVHGSSEDSADACLFALSESEVACGQKPGYMTATNGWRPQPLYTTPQPTQPQAGHISGAKSFQTYAEANAYSKGYYAGKKAAKQAQAGAVPLTDEQIKDLQDDGVFLGTCRQIVRAIEAAHGIKGGQHGTE